MMYGITLENGLSIAPCWDAAESLSCLLLISLSALFFLCVHVQSQAESDQDGGTNRFFFVAVLYPICLYIYNKPTSLLALTAKACMQLPQMDEVPWVLIKFNEVSMKGNSILQSCWGQNMGYSQRGFLWATASSWPVHLALEKGTSIPGGNTYTGFLLGWG